MALAKKYDEDKASNFEISDTLARKVQELKMKMNKWKNLSIMPKEEQVF